MILSLLTVLALLGTQAFAQCGVQVQWSPAGSGDTETSQNGCIWTVQLTRTALTGNVIVTVTGVNNADVEITVENPTAIRQTFINVGGSVRDLRILRKHWNNQGPVIAQNIAADRHIGWAGGSLAIEVNGVQNSIFAGGDVLSRIKIDGEDSSPIKYLELLEVHGDVKANIEVSQSQLKELIVDGSLGTGSLPGTRIDVDAGSTTAGSRSIGTIRAQSINADITARHFFDIIETTGGAAGDFSGSIVGDGFRWEIPGAKMIITGACSERWTTC